MIRFHVMVEFLALLELADGWSIRSTQSVALSILSSQWFWFQSNPPLGPLAESSFQAISNATEFRNREFGS